jgi:hypothetical protein
MVALLLTITFILTANQMLFAQTQYYRLLVVVTPAAYNAIGSAQLRTRISDRILSNANLCYANSPVNIRVELAGIVRTNYIERSGGIGPDLDSLRTRGNSGTDPISTLRALYCADLVTLIEANTDFNVGTQSGVAGLGYTQSAVPQYGYCCLNYMGISLAPTAAHEIGHNFGCMHDTITMVSQNDLDFTWPTTYCHGFITSSWGTVMSYTPSYINCFSNPDSSWNSIHRGSAFRCNNTRMLTENIGVINNFSTTKSKVAVPASTWKANEYGDILSVDSITIGSRDSLKDSSEVLLRASQRISINSGFFVGSKAKLTINAGPGTSLAKKRSQPPQNNPKLFAADESTLFGLNRVYRKLNILHVCYSLTYATPITFSIYDVGGRLILTQKQMASEIGHQTALIDISKISKQKVYVVKMVTEQYSKQMKVSGL